MTRRIKRGLCLLLALLAALCTGCSTAEESLPAQLAPAETQRLVVYTSHKEEVWQPIVREFEARTGIWVDVVTGGTSELLERIQSERQNPKADVMFGGGVESLASYSSCFAPWVSAQQDSIPAELHSPEHLWTPFSSLPVVLIYNTKLVDPTWVIRWNDLLSPKLTGRIAFADPVVSGSAFTGLVTCLQAIGGTPEDTMRRLAANMDGRRLDTSGQVLEAVQDGTCLVGVTLEETAMQWIESGKDLAMVYPLDGTSMVPDGSALVQGAPHLENAEQFLEFTVSADVQRLLADQFYRRPIRTDVAENPVLRPMEDIPLVEYDVAWASANRDSLLMSWLFYLGGGDES